MQAPLWGVDSASNSAFLFAFNSAISTLPQPTGIILRAHPIRSQAGKSQNLFLGEPIICDTINVESVIDACWPIFECI